MAETGAVAIAVASEPGASADEASDVPAATVVGRCTSERWFVVTSTLCIALVLFVGVRAALEGWMPLGDDGFFALRAHDVFTRHPPLLGTASSAATYSGAPTNHPGPLQFFLLAVPVAVFGVGPGAVVGQAVINASALGGASWLLRRRLGPVAGAVGAVCLLGLAWAMGSALLHDVWGPWAVILPFALFLVAVGLATGGDARALPVVAVAGSLVLQTHASYVLLVPGLGLLAFGGVLLFARLDRADPDASSVRRWVAVGVAVAVLCWVPPVLQQVRNEPGNLGALWRAARADSPATVPFDEAVFVVAGTVALPPWWFPPGFEHPKEAYGWVDADQAHPLADAGMAAVVVLLAVGLFSAGRRRDRLALSALVTAAVGLGLGFLSVMRAPGYGVWSGSYTRFLWPISIWVWFSLGLAATRAWLDRRPGPHGRPARLAMPATVVVTVVVGAALLPHRDNMNVDREPWQRNVHPLMDAVMAEVRDIDGPILLVDVVSEANFVYTPMLMAQFAEDEIDFVVDNPVLVRQVGGHREAVPGHEPVAELWVMPEVDPTFDGKLLFLSDELPSGKAAEMERLTDELSHDGAERGPLRLSPIAREFLVKYAPDMVPGIESRLAVGRYTPGELAALVRLVYGASLVWPDGDELDTDALDRWSALGRQREGCRRRVPARRWRLMPLPAAWGKRRVL